MLDALTDDGPAIGPSCLNSFLPKFKAPVTAPVIPDAREPNKPELLLFFDEVIDVTGYGIGCGPTGVGVFATSGNPCDCPPAFEDLGLKNA